MAAGKSVADILAGAKDTLNHANALSDSTAKEVERVAPKPAPTVSTAPPKHEFSNAPYSAAREANGLGKELRARLEMNAKGKQALQ